VVQDPVAPSRSAALSVGLALIFVRFSMIHQLIALETGLNFYLLYVFGIPTLIGVIVVGGFPRSFRARPAWYWTAFGVWIAISAPLSTWRGGSVEVLLLYLRTSWLMVFVVAGLVVSWKDCQRVLSTVAWATVFNLLSSRGFQGSTSGDRLGLDFGSVGNANDFAAHLLLVLPFLFWKAISTKSFFVRILALLGVLYGVYTIFATGSRGALIALLAGSAFILLRGTGRQRLGLILLAPVVIGVVVLTIPDKLLNRIGSFAAQSSTGSIEAQESTRAREYVFGKSIDYTLQFPIFGVGPGEFAAYEGSHNQVIGTHGLWHQTHDTWTQVSSECGIPGLLFFIGGVLSSFFLLNRTYRKAKQQPGCEDIRLATFCLMLGMLCFSVAVTFLSFAYFLYFPFMAGLAIAVSSAAEQEFRTRPGNLAQAQPQPPAYQHFAPRVFTARTRPAV
jgi:O-antigen ligase